MPRRSSGPSLPAPPDSLVFGLGNPGERYRATRHNLGFRVVDALASAAGASWSDAPGPSLASSVAVAGRSVVLAKPLTWMNRSGVSVRALRELLGGPDPGAILVVADDLDLPLGRLRFRPGGGAGGHKGLRSIIAELGSDDFPRLRLGIGRPGADEPDDVVDHVLDPFLPDEEGPVAEMVERACRGVEVFLAEGVGPAMNRFNASPAAADPAPGLDPPEARR